VGDEASTNRAREREVTRGRALGGESTKWVACCSDAASVSDERLRWRSDGTAVNPAADFEGVCFLGPCGSGDVRHERLCLARHPSGHDQRPEALRTETTEHRKHSYADLERAPPFQGWRATRGRATNPTTRARERHDGGEVDSGAVLPEGLPTGAMRIVSVSRSPGSAPRATLRERR